MAVGITIGITLLVGLTIVRALPRGPATASQALAVMAAGLAVGGLAGLIMRSRWAMIIAPMVERVNVMRGLLDMFTVMYPQLQAIDFRQSVQQLDVPLYILDGASELPARRDLLLDWFEQVDAPRKELFTFENATHSVAFEQFETLSQIMTETVLPETYSN